MRDVCWVNENIYEDNKRVRKGERRKRTYRMFLCLTCSRVHEISYVTSGRIVNYHVDFPTYGLDRKTCDSCSDEQE